MYKNKLVSCIKIDDNFLQEEKRSYYLPKNSKYSIYFKNENKKEVFIKVYVDDILLNRYFTIKPKGKKDIKFNEYSTELKFKKGESTIKIDFIYLNDNQEINSYIETNHSMKLTLNESGGTEVSTTKDKKVCTTCGKKFKNSYNFCPYDGAFLNDY